jgi:hypothetical protein
VHGVSVEKNKLNINEFEGGTRVPLCENILWWKMHGKTDILVLPQHGPDSRSLKIIFILRTTYVNTTIL